MAETIENNVRKVIIDGKPINPKYYERMSELLDMLIEQRRKEALSYEEYLQKIKQLAENLNHSGEIFAYPDSIDTRGKQSLYDNLENNHELVIRIDTAIRHRKKADWKYNKFKLRAVESAVKEELAAYGTNNDDDVKNVMEIIKNQVEYE